MEAGRLLEAGRLFEHLRYLLLGLVNQEFFFYFSKIWVGRAMGNEALNWDGLISVTFGKKNPTLCEI